MNEEFEKNGLYDQNLFTLSSELLAWLFPHYNHILMQPSLRWRRFFRPLHAIAAVTFATLTQTQGIKPWDIFPFSFSFFFSSFTLICYLMHEGERHMLSLRGRRLKNKPREVKCERIWLGSGLGRKTYRLPARSLARPSLSPPAD